MRVSDRHAGLQGVGRPDADQSYPPHCQAGLLVPTGSGKGTGMAARGVLTPAQPMSRGGPTILCPFFLCALWSIFH